ncbi:MAG: sigma-E processing peptidase SpoIIGA [Bacilli bacterium]|nr:sigma-E processing peptidase SpoIIGA [Bacilli bacterium]
MKVYLDIVIILNFVIDSMLLFTVASILKRQTSIKRIILASLVGELSIIHLFIHMNTFILFIYKMLISFIMVIVAFKYEDIKFTLNNYVYLFMTSFILGGTLTFLDSEGISYYILLIFIPIVLYGYIKTQKKITTDYSFYYNIKIVFNNNKEVCLTAFLDTGNKLVDPITNEGIILVEKEVLDGLVRVRSPIYVPYNSLNNHSLLKCIKPKYIEINNHKFTNYLIGISEVKFNIDGVKCILNYKIMEDINA